MKWEWLLDGNSFRIKIEGDNTTDMWDISI